MDSSPRSPVEIEALLQRMNDGDPYAQNELFPAVYDTLRGMARRALGGDGGRHTLQATALVHEAWLRMCGNREARWNDREHFMRVAAMAMRRILTDHARRRNADKRIPRDKLMHMDDHLQLDEVLAVFDRCTGGHLIDLDDALTELALRDRNLAEFAEVRFFGGATIAEAARIVGVGESQGIAMWRTAKAWLRRRLGE